MNGPPEQKITGTSTHSAGEPLGVGRRRFLTWMIAAPTLTMGAKFGLDLLAPSPAAADPPTALDLVVTVTPENRVTAALTRLESGQGITTLMAMLLAEELDARLIDVDITLADANATEVLMFTGGSNNARVLTDPTRIVAAGMRARL